MIQRSHTIVNCSVLIRILQRQECTILPGFLNHKTGFRNQLLGYRNQHLTSRFKSQDAAAWEMWYKQRLDSYTNWLESRRQPPGFVDLDKRPREPSSSSSSEEDPDMILDPHMLLQFPPGTEAHTRLKRFIGMEIVEPRTIDWSILATLGATERATAIIGASGPWRRMMEMGGLPAYREIGMMRWMTERMAASAGMDIPVFPGPGHHQDPGGHA
ncbi:hypothetical protein E3N88_17740 [Mikania micrantha]|uniref:Uncharacterized protein n=1 Tax=Mikania micrantha TaxID=192012 RepID=A0A5N6NT87_9ASTR|nr:hypothetical protein E3N88_17740 [Mikania micrantha]